MNCVNLSDKPIETSWSLTGTKLNTSKSEVIKTTTEKEVHFSTPHKSRQNHASKPPLSTPHLKPVTPLDSKPSPLLFPKVNLVKQSIDPMNTYSPTSASSVRQYDFDSVESKPHHRRNTSDSGISSKIHHLAPLKTDQCTTPLRKSENLKRGPLERSNSVAGLTVETNYISPRTNACYGSPSFKLKALPQPSPKLTSNYLGLTSSHKTIISSSSGSVTPLPPVTPGGTVNFNGIASSSVTKALLNSSNSNSSTGCGNSNGNNSYIKPTIPKLKLKSPNSPLPSSSSSNSSTSPPPAPPPLLLSIKNNNNNRNKNEVKVEEFDDYNDKRNGSIDTDDDDVIIRKDKHPSPRSPLNNNKSYIQQQQQQEPPPVEIHPFKVKTSIHIEESIKPLSPPPSPLPFDLSINIKAIMSQEKNHIPKDIDDFNKVNKKSTTKKKDFIKLQFLGKGASGRVFKAIHVPTLTIVAVKVVEIVEPEKRKQLINELNTLEFNRVSLTSLNRSNCNLIVPCPFIVTLFDVFNDEARNRACIVMEYINNGSLQNAIDECQGFSDVEILTNLAYQVLKGLQFIHNNHHIHRDIKPSNILITENGHVKISDFGISKSLQSQSVADTFIGTLAYMSPKRIKGESYSYSSDIWSFGLTFYTLATGFYPYSLDGGYWKLLNRIQNQTLPVLNEEDFSKDFVDFLSLCLNKDEDKIPPIDELLNHPFILNRHEENEDIPIMNETETARGVLEDYIDNIIKYKYILLFINNSIHIQYGDYKTSLLDDDSDDDDDDDSEKISKNKLFIKPQYSDEQFHYFATELSVSDELVKQTFESVYNKYNYHISKYGYDYKKSKESKRLGDLFDLDKDNLF